MSTSRSNRGRAMATRTERRRAAVDRRREFARRGVTAQVRARRRRARIRWTIGAVVVAVVGVAAIVLIATRDDGDGIPNLALTGKRIDAEGALGITAPLDAYTVDYELTTYGSNPASPTTATEQLRVARPFSSQITFTQDGETSTYTSVLGKASAVDSSGTTVSVVPAGPGTFDWRLDATLDDLVASGEVTLAERREVAGRECQVYRTGSPLETNTVVAATDTDYAEMCIDASGLLLEEISYVNGIPSQHVKATAVAEGPVDGLAVDGEPTDTTRTFTDVGTDAAPADGYWTLSTVPDGFELVGRYAYTVPGEDAEDPTTDPTDPTAETTVAPEPAPVTSWFDVYRRGGDYVIVHQGPTSQEPTPSGTTAEATIDALGTVTTSSAFTGTTIVAHPTTPADWFVAISGSVDLATLTGIAGALAG